MAGRDYAGGDFHGIVSRDEEGAQTKGFNVGRHANDNKIPIHENDIDRKSHEKHVNGLTAGNNERFLRLK